MAKNLHISLIDDDGEAHEYAIRKHGAISSARLMSRLLPILGELLNAREAIATALVEITKQVGAARKAKPQPKTEDAKPEEPSIGAVLGAIDHDALGQILEAALGALPGAVDAGARLLGDEELIRELFSRVTRDGAQLKGAHAFDVAFEDNLGELLIALRHIIQHNYAKAIRRLMGNALGGKSPELKAKLQRAGGGFINAFK